MKAHKAFIGDDHNIVDTFVFNDAGKLFDSSGSCKQLRFRPVKEHHKDFHDLLKSTVISYLHCPHR